MATASKLQLIDNQTQLFTYWTAAQKSIFDNQYFNLKKKDAATMNKPLLKLQIPQNISTFAVNWMDCVRQTNFPI